MARGKKGTSTKKDPYRDVEKEFKAAVDGGTPEQIRERIAKVALDQAALMAAKDLDQDLKDKKAAASYANETYRDGTKFNKLRIAYCRMVLGRQGKEDGDSGIDETTGRLKRVGEVSSVKVTVGNNAPIVLTPAEFDKAAAAIVKNAAQKLSEA